MGLVVLKDRPDRDGQLMFSVCLLWFLCEECVNTQPPVCVIEYLFTLSADKVR